MLKAIAMWLGYWVVRGLAATWRFRHEGASPVPAPPHCAGYILAIWHQNLFAGILAQTGRRHVVIISRSRDGDPVSLLCTRLGHCVTRGSSRKGETDKGGREAKDQMIEVLRSGVPGAITVDGPRGPAHVVKPGIIDMARATGLPIVPYLAIASHYWSLKSWDAFRVPRPFSRIDVIYGAPVAVPPDTDYAAFAGLQSRIAGALHDMERAHATGITRAD